MIHLLILALIDSFRLLDLLDMQRVIVTVTSLSRCQAPNRVPLRFPPRVARWRLQQHPSLHQLAQQSAVDAILAAPLHTLDPAF
mmetsp:Transcript_15812/g.47985  ORF Transcript_15812/g.47985 Transcript_15812/m.47985 type:complete len:84 (+) Transcript_15812:128-379(+)